MTTISTQNRTQGQDMAAQGWTLSDVLAFAQRLQFPPAETQELIAGYRAIFSQT